MFLLIILYFEPNFVKTSIGKVVLQILWYYAITPNENFQMAAILKPKPIDQNLFIGTKFVGALIAKIQSGCNPLVKHVTKIRWLDEV